jgi:hypothetical protein
MLTFCNSYVLWQLRYVQLRLVTVTFFDVNVVWCYVLSQYRRTLWCTAYFPFSFEPGKLWAKTVSLRSEKNWRETIAPYVKPFIFCFLFKMGKMWVRTVLWAKSVLFKIEKNFKWKRRTLFLTVSFDNHTQHPAYTSVNLPYRHCHFYLQVFCL